MLSLIKPQRNILSLILKTVTVLGCSNMGSNPNSSDKYKNYKSLADFGYAFNEQGELRDVKNSKPFTFVVRIFYHISSSPTLNPMTQYLRTSNYQ